MDEQSPRIGAHHASHTEVGSGDGVRLRHVAGGEEIRQIGQSQGIEGAEEPSDQSEQAEQHRRFSAEGRDDRQPHSPQQADRHQHVFSTVPITQHAEGHLEHETAAHKGAQQDGNPSRAQPLPVSVYGKAGRQRRIEEPI